MNNENTNIESGERLSFFKLFSEKGYHVEIPIIQRDYAQGRNSSSEVRELFLNDLHDYLAEDKPNRDLDFVYGSISDEKNAKFIPLDGQQRLTTLFLLHWYLANISENMHIFRQALAIEANGEYQSKFTYETRPSSKEFCDALMTNEVNMGQLLEPDLNMQNSLSKTIQNFGWYFLSWNYDPTIQSMLTMLDTIHSKFAENRNYFLRLTDLEKPRITFLFLNLKKFKLTDDLYIKMNARGMPLTTFENFKAKFEQHIGNLIWHIDDLRKLRFSQEGKEEKAERKVYPKEYFAHKIDTDWAHLFWKYCYIGETKENKENDFSYDKILMNFIRVIMSNDYAINKGADENLEFLIGTQIATKRLDYTNNITYHIYKKFGALDQNSVSYLIDALDALENGDDKIKEHLSNTFYFNENEIFEKVLKHDLTRRSQRVQFHAYLRHLIFNKGNSTGIDQWMRVVHNLTENRRIEGADEVASATASIEKLVPESHDILNYLKFENNRVDFFFDRQIQEEKIKAHLISKSDRWKNAIEKTEQHTYFKGQIAFILEFSGILAYYIEQFNCAWSEESDNKYFNEFIKYSDCASATFDAIDPDQKRNSGSIDYLWERAVLSKGDYLIPTSACRKNFLSTTANTRDFSWKRLLRLPQTDTPVNEVEIWKERRGFVKAVFDDVRFNKKDLEKSLIEICKSLPGDWRKCVIESPKLVEYCSQGFIRFESDYNIILFMHSQQNHRQREMYTFHFYLKKLEGKNIDPFSESGHEEVSNSYENSYAWLCGCCINRINYEILIYYNKPNDNFPNPYQIRFLKSKGSKALDDYPDNIQALLKQSGYKWYDDKDWFGFWSTKDNEDSTLEAIETLGAYLSKL